MGDLGLNFPADASIPAQAAAFLGARWVRVVAKHGIDLRPWLQDAKVRGINVLLVLARESFANNLPNDQIPYLAWCLYYAGMYGDLVSAVQGGNESDHESPSSWTMAPADLNALLQAINTAFGASMTVVGPGLVSGHPEYLDDVNLDLVDAIAVHGYGQRPDNVQDWSETPGNFGTIGALFDRYREHAPGKPIWATEIGLSTTECSEDFQARYCEAMMKALKLRADVPVAMWFCHSDTMVPEFGLRRIDGSMKPSAAAFMRAAGPMPKPEPEPDQCERDRQALLSTLAYVKSRPQRDIKKKKLLELLGAA